jgi:hypothetical protein
MIATRPQFVALRNAFADLIEAEVRRGDAVPIRYSEQRAAIPPRLADMRAAYDALCIISAMPAPVQVDFDRAESICAAWGI